MKRILFLLCLSAPSPVILASAAPVGEGALPDIPALPSEGLFDGEGMAVVFEATKNLCKNPKLTPQEKILAINLFAEIMWSQVPKRNAQPKSFAEFFVKVRALDNIMVRTKWLVRKHVDKRFKHQIEELPSLIQNPFSGSFSESARLVEKLIRVQASSDFFIPVWRLIQLIIREIL